MINLIRRWLLRRKCRKLLRQKDSWQETARIMHGLLDKQNIKPDDKVIYD
jgi:hypothetical protein